MPRVSIIVPCRNEELHLAAFADSVLAQRLPAGWMLEIIIADGMLGVTGVYLGVLGFANVPRGMWRFSGFAEVKRLLLACLAAGAISAVAVLALGLREVPRAVLALHPVMTLMGLCTVRVLYRMGNAARRRYEDHFTAATMTAHISDLYASLPAPRRRLQP